jgi:glycosyltransferase involved in cell wall biosynthesis
MKSANPTISIIVPLFNEAENLTALYAELTAVLKTMHVPYECLFIDDGSTDTGFEILQLLVKKDSHIRAIRFRTNFGKASALQAGFDAAKGDYVVQIDADLQDNPTYIPACIETLRSGYDMVVGWKQHRKDTLVKNRTSTLFNSVTNLISPVKLHDHNCGFKAYTKEVIASLQLYGDLHRYIAVLVSSRGFRVAELPIEHRKRHAGVSKYGPGRFMNGLFDFITVLFLTRFHGRPLHFFGYIGTAFFVLGLVVNIYLSFVKFIGHQAIGHRPLLLFGVMLMIMGLEVGMSGIVSEQIAAITHRNTRSYDIKETAEHE